MNFFIFPLSFAGKKKTRELILLLPDGAVIPYRVSSCCLLFFWRILNVFVADPRFGLACLGKVNMVYENDQDLMIRFYGFVAK